MGRTLREKLNKLPKERRERILAEAKRLCDEYLEGQEVGKRLEVVSD